MDTSDRQAISGLFDKLAEVERQAPSRDADADRFIGDAIARQPGAPYYMAQTVVVQEHALNNAQARIEQLEGELAAAQQRGQGGGFLSGLFGGGAPAACPVRWIWGGCRANWPRLRRKPPPTASRAGRGSSSTCRCATGC
ncbi:DUF2076 domain-containing protein [Mangrovicoccus ximenensis]|uniref:DUF2076 domain-containing protein n=1 Tax=Mangrovicoccus ximenensis TaxID=1911570 RepID=UPI000D366299|nr:DUF2076 domain-containing protein [Mangrovicoccus ximenensis]